MEPKLPTPNFGRERTPASYGQGIEQSAEQLQSPESAIEGRVEHIEQRAEAGASQTLPPPVLPTLPQIPVPVAAPVQPSTMPVNDLPLAANDDDLIEKEWVDKAKKIIIDTKDDPYRREQEVSRLQIDYLRKRYGRELGASQ